MNDKTDCWTQNIKLEPSGDIINGNGERWFFVKNHRIEGEVERLKGKHGIFGYMIYPKVYYRDKRYDSEPFPNGCAESLEIAKKIVEMLVGIYEENEIHNK